MPPIAPAKFVHVVYRTRRYAEMVRWYQTVFGATVRHQDPALAFLTYDDEHHRFAVLNLDVVMPDAPATGGGSVGVDHVAYTYASLAELFATYTRLAEVGIRPYWCIHHGITVSLYYGDPDGNQMELQVDAMDVAAATAFMAGPEFRANPIGVEFSPDAWLAQVRAGTAWESFLPRTEHLPVSPVRRAG